MVVPPVTSRYSPMPIPTPLPWRSLWLPRLAVFFALLAGLPLYLLSPLWCDITLYDLAARNLLKGGVHYRDLFDTNLPGFVWLLTGLRYVFGSSAIVVRIADLFIVTAVVALIDRLAKWSGANCMSRWWGLVGVAFLYPFAIEMVHAQRDTWMALPALAAVVLRVRRLRVEGGESTPQSLIGKAFPQSVLEGAVWGLAVWIKPHVVLVAAGIWLFTFRRLAAGHPRPLWLIATDLGGNVLGGLVVGLCGTSWLIASGTWPHFWSVVTVWNPKYMEVAGQEFELRLKQELYWFPPWSMFLLPTVPLAVLTLIDAAPWAGRDGLNDKRPGPIGRLLPGCLWDRQAGVDARYTRAVLAALYLVWMGQALLVQRRYTYVHIPETFLMIGLWAAHRWAMPILPLLWMAVTSAVWLFADANPEFREELLTVATDKHISAEVDEERFIVRHPLADLHRMRCWADCWRCNRTERERYALWDRLQRIRDHEAAISWEELYDVAEFLRTKSVTDREVLAWNDSPHAVYLMLGIQPGVRFMHISTAQGMGEMGYWQVQNELAATAGTARYAIGDLKWVAQGEEPENRLQLLGPPRSPDDLLPAALRPWHRATFPFNQPTVFRSAGGFGRYTVHQLTPPFGDKQ